MTQSATHSHAEAATNAVAVFVLAQFVLFAFNLPFGESIALNASMLAVSYVRAFIIRRIFDGWAR